MLCASLDGRVVWDRIETFKCLFESHHCSPETTTILLIGYIPIQNKKLENSKKKKKKQFRVSTKESNDTLQEFLQISILSDYNIYCKRMDSDK